MLLVHAQLPKGPITKSSPGLNPVARYKARYFEGDNASGAPFIHAIGILFLVGYTIDYNMHLKHHKNNVRFLPFFFFLRARGLGWERAS